MARTMVHNVNGRPSVDARRRAAILDRIEERDERDIRDMLQRMAGTDLDAIRRSVLR